MNVRILKQSWCLINSFNFHSIDQKIESDFDIRFAFYLKYVLKLSQSMLQIDWNKSKLYESHHDASINGY